MIQPETESLLAVHDLSLSYTSQNRQARVVNSVNFSIRAGEVVGILGESGSGKTSLALAILGLLHAGARIESGSIRLRGKELLGQQESELQKIRGKEISLIFQEPGIALNPVMRVGRQIVEVLRAHYSWSESQCRAEVESMLGQVRFSDVDRIYSAYPHQLSGGQRQRVAIAQALIAKPALVIADEPTSSLDATIQAEILGLLKDMQQRLSLAFLLISHNPAILQTMAQRILVMNSGEIIEQGNASQVLGKPQHPFTQRLLACMPPPPAGKRKAPTNLPAPLESGRSQ